MSNRRSNPFKDIIRKVWSKLKQTRPTFSTDYHQSVIDKVLNCGDPSNGYVEYRCQDCWHDTHKVAFSCKSKFCIYCSRKSSNDFIEEVSGKLHPDVVYRHLILTMPSILGVFFYKNRMDKTLLKMFMWAGRDFIEDVFRKITRVYDLQIGCLTVIHSAGRKGNWNPHLHIIVMNGGLSPSTGRWVNLRNFPYKKYLPKKWQWHLLTMVKKYCSSLETNKMVDELWKEYPNGFVNKFQKGDVPRKMGHLVRYLAKYISKPSISVSSIKKVDHQKEQVTYKYKDHRTHREKYETCSFFDFVGRLGQQILPKCFHRIKYFGLQHPSSYKKKSKLISEGMVKSGMKISSDTFVVKYAVGNWKWERDPRKCSMCSSVLEISRIWSKKYGTLFDIFDDWKKSIPPPKDEPKTINNFALNNEVRGLCGIQLSFYF